MRTDVHRIIIQNSFYVKNAIADTCKCCSDVFSCRIRLFQQIRQYDVPTTRFQFFFCCFFCNCCFPCENIAEMIERRQLCSCCTGVKVVGGRRL